MALIGFISLGCAKNQVDCERMMYRVKDAGYDVSGGVEGCDVVVINTCGFIDSAKSEAIENILTMGALKAEGRIGKILVTGCLSQRYQDQIMAEMPEVDGVLGTGSYTEIVPAIEKLLADQNVSEFGDIDAPEVESGRIVTTPEHYAFIKIAEGCDNHCAYCVIPSLRGKFRSRKMEDVLYEANLLAESGVKELPGVSPDTKAYAVPFREYRIEPTARIGDISIYYGVSVEDIFIYNNITNGMIIAGTVLKIPSPKEVPIDYKVPHTIYTVEPTAKIEDIAKHYGVTPDMIKRFNYIEAIATGMQLKIPYPVTSELYKIPFAAYTVPEGATLENIAKHYGIAPADIQAFNPNIEIKAGAAIRIPGVAPDSPPYVPPTKTEENKQ